MCDGYSGEESKPEAPTCSRTRSRAFLNTALITAWRRIVLRVFESLFHHLVCPLDHSTRFLFVEGNHNVCNKCETRPSRTNLMWFHNVRVTIYQGRPHSDFRLLPEISAYPTNTTHIELTNVSDDVKLVVVSFLNGQLNPCL